MFRIFKSRSYSRPSDKVKVTGAKKREISPRHPSVTYTAQSRCNCTDGNSISLMQGMTLRACSHRGAAGRHV